MFCQECEGERCEGGLWGCGKIVRKRLDSENDWKEYEMVIVGNRSRRQLVQIPEELPRFVFLLR
jgi:hypothetical protein